MEFTAQRIAEFLGGTIEGNANVTVSNISRIEDGKPGTLSFLANPKYTRHIYNTKASIVLVNSNLQLDHKVNTTLIRVEDAYQAFASLLKLYDNTNPDRRGVSDMAFISESATIGKDVYIAPFVYIGDNVVVGDNVKIYPQAYISYNTKIGKGTILASGVKVYNDCQIGENCMIHAGSIIGSDGFGFAPKSTEYQKVPQIGNVIIEDDVEIGSNTTIDRATIGSTIIRRGVKLDNLIQIAHNVEIGENTVIAAQSGISGSTKIGKSCMFGGQVGVIGHLEIADEVKIAAQSGISNTIKTPGAILQGAPAYNVRDYQRSYVIYRKLPEMYRKIGQLEKELEQLKQKLNEQ